MTLTWRALSQLNKMNTNAAGNKISVVIPAKNASRTIAECLDSIYSSRSVDFEVIVVDDGCTDDTIDIASKYNCLVLKNNLQIGVSGARNAGARVSTGEVLVFIDTDIVVPGNALSRIAVMIDTPGVSAIVGMLGEKIRFNNFSSQYKNLWMSYTFNNLPESISLIFSSIAAIKKDCFLECGGFDINYRYPNVEDNELGIKLSDRGYGIILDKTLQVEHLKHYTLFTLLKTHYLRTKGLIKLFHRNKLITRSKGNPSNVPGHFILNIPLTMALIGILISLVSKNYFSYKIAVLSLLVLSFILANCRWLFFLKKRRGALFMFLSLIYLPFEFVLVIAGLFVGQVEYLLGRKY